MQSDYGGPEMQQFMVDGSFSSLLQHQQQPQPLRFHHLQSIPITQQFFQQQQHPQFFQAFQQQQQRRLHQQLGLDMESVPESSNPQPRIIGGSGGGGGSGGLAFLAGNFKLAASESSGRRDVLHEDDPIVVMGGEDASDSQTTAVAFHPWEQQQPPPPQREEESTKEPFWKPLAVEYVNRNNKRCKEKLETPNKFSKKSNGCKEQEEGNASGSNYGLFGELEAIYAHGGAVGGGGNNQTGSGSALTGDNNPPATAATAVVQGPTGVPSSGIDHGSETSNGEEASLKRLQKRGRRKKKKMWNHMGSIVTFFESLVKQLMDHQEGLHRKFLEVMEKKDQERTEREQAWRQQEAEKSNLEAVARTQERSISSSREAAIISFLEKITGESVNLPKPPQFQFNSDQFHEEPTKEDKPIEQPNVIPNQNSTQKIISFSNTRRWPKAEVQALIRVRSSLESKFQEPGLKGPLWEEVSSSMASMGYQRSAKRCKEKWENINKYFRKTKDTAKKRSQHSKTCPYFHQLHQLYSKSSNASPTLPTVMDEEQQQRKDNSELLDAIVIAPPNNDQENEQNPSLQFIQKQIEDMNQSYKLTQMISIRMDNESDIAKEGSSARSGKEILGNEEDYEEDDGDDDDDQEVGSGGDDENDDVEEEERENHDHVRNQGIGRKHGEEEKHHHQKPIFFCLES